VCVDDHTSSPVIPDPDRGPRGDLLDDEIQEEFGAEL
jgi:hypothetical protein